MRLLRPLPNPPDRGREGLGQAVHRRAAAAAAPWAYPKDTLRVVDARPSEWTEEARVGKRPWRFPARPIGSERPRDGLVLLADDVSGLTGHDASDPTAQGEYPAQAVLFLRNREGSERLKSGGGWLLTDAEHEWLPRARRPKEAGYAEGLFMFGPWRWKLPVAVVVSTAEYEYLESLGS
jgi:hypothetical protein